MKLKLNYFARKKIFVGGLIGFIMIPSCERQEQQRVSSENTQLLVRTQSVNHHDEILPVQDTLVRPVLYSQTVSLKSLPVQDKIKKFVDLMLPAILVAKYNLEKKRQFVVELMQKDSITLTDSLKLNKLLVDFKSESLRELEQKLHTHPISIVLAQAALESGWGTSHLFLNANNIFGVCSFNSSEPRVKYEQDGKTIYYREYTDLSLAVEDYFKTIARSRAYREFRKHREQNDDPFQLIPYLHRYSELGSTYTNRLSFMIRKYELDRFDKYQIDPRYLWKGRILT